MKSCDFRLFPFLLALLLPSLLSGQVNTARLDSVSISRLDKGGSTRYKLSGEGDKQINIHME